MLEGIDLSNNNGSVDLAHEKDARGLSFVFHKASEGTTFRDGLYAARRAQAAALGLVWGAYHFAHPSGDPVAQADFFVATAELDLGLAACDLEVTDGRPWSEVANFAYIFCDRVEQRLGSPCLLYSYAAFLRTMPTARLTRFRLWAAEPGNASAPPYLDRWSTWTFHQYGQSGGLDQNHFNGTATDLGLLAGTHVPAGPPAVGPWWNVDYIPTGVPIPAPVSTLKTVHVQAIDAPTAERMVPPGATFVDVHGPLAS